MPNLRLMLGGLLAIALVLALALLAARRSGHVAVTPLPPQRAGAEWKVYVSGAVQQPGVYTIQPGDRVEDGIRQAGGPTEDADLVRINLAVRLRDELQVHVPHLPPSGTPAAEPSPPQPVAAAAGSGPVRPGVAVTAPGDTRAVTGPIGARPTPTLGPLNINTATAAQLERLPGIGEVTARRVVEFRQQNGPYRSLEDVRRAGVSLALLQRAAPYLTFE